MCLVLTPLVTVLSTSRYAFLPLMYRLWRLLTLFFSRQYQEATVEVEEIEEYEDEEIAE